MEPKNTQETLAALSATNPAGVVALMFAAIRKTWRLAGAARKWLRDAFTDRVPSWRFRSLNMEVNAKAGRICVNYLSKSATYSAAKSPTRRRRIRSAEGRSEAQSAE
jgi:hypothetical protein